MASTASSSTTTASRAVHAGSPRPLLSAPPGIKRRQLSPLGIGSNPVVVPSTFPDRIVKDVVKHLSRGESLATPALSSATASASASAATEQPFPQFLFPVPGVLPGLLTPSSASWDPATLVLKALAEEANKKFLNSMRYNFASMGYGGVLWIPQPQPLTPVMGSNSVVTPSAVSVTTPVAANNGPSFEAAPSPASADAPRYTSFYKVGTPVSTPVSTPVTISVDTPVDTPVDTNNDPSFQTTPSTAPVAALTASYQVYVETPAAAPVTIPVDVRVASPVATPVTVYDSSSFEAAPLANPVVPSAGSEGPTKRARRDEYTMTPASASATTQSLVDESAQPITANVFPERLSPVAASSVSLSVDSWMSLDQRQEIARHHSHSKKRPRASVETFSSLSDPSTELDAAATVLFAAPLFGQPLPNANETATASASTSGYLSHDQEVSELVSQSPQSATEALTPSSGAPWTPTTPQTPITGIKKSPFIV
jgi:hypothetical protein